MTHKMNDNEMIRKIIEYIPNEKLKFERNIHGDVAIIFVNRNSIMSIMTSNTWLEIKRIIDSKISDIKPDECILCNSNKLIHITKVSCNRCANSWCIGCNTKIMLVNKGLVICPYCKFTFGNVVPPHILIGGIEEILGRYNENIQKEIIKYLNA